jgi:hypothetical protein
VTQESSETRGRGLRAAQAAFVVGLLYAAISVYWAVGGTWLLDTVGASLVQAARGASAGVLFAVWAAAVLKVIATVLPLLAVHAAAPPGSRWRRVLRVLTWVEAVILVLYGLVLTATGLLVQSGLVPTDATADHRALRWHAYLWDPWFLVWGLLVTAALWRSRGSRQAGAVRRASAATCRDCRRGRGAGRRGRPRSAARRRQARPFPARHRAPRWSAR